MLQVVAEQLPPDRAQRFLHRADLGENVGTVTVFLDHLVQASYLPFDSAQALEIPVFDIRVNRDRVTFIVMVFHVFLKLKVLNWLCTVLDPAGAAGCYRLSIPRRLNAECAENNQ
jgi:hypothetical protein